MKTKLNFLIVLAVLVGLMFNPGAVHAQSAAPGTVIAWGERSQSIVPAGLTNITAISAGTHHNLALQADGTVVAWGYGGPEYGQSSVPAELSGVTVTAISAGEYHSLALKANGTVVAWGSNDKGQSSVPAGLSSVTAISAGAYHSLALQADGTVVAWGYNFYGQGTIPTGLTGVTAIAAGGFHNLALKSNGTVVAWGDNSNGQSSVPGGLTDVIAIAGGDLHSLALKADGTVVAWGSNDQGQRTIPTGLTGVTAIAAGGFHNLALKADGTVVAWGYNGQGQISGAGAGSGVTAIAAGKYHNLAIVNTIPVANPGGPYLGAINTPIAFDGSLSSDPNSDPITYAWTFGDGSTGTGPTPTHSYTESGIYNTCLTVNDGTVASAAACTMAVVYDPSAGFVTGSGLINSPTGAYRPDPSLTGQATFGFVSKYKKGASVPTGTTQFQFSVASLNFYAETYEWLVVNQGGMNAQFKGSGLINGEADPNGNAYKFMLWAGDGSPDTFQIKIWWEGALGAETIVYENDTALEIGAGNIVVHTKK